MKSIPKIAIYLLAITMLLSFLPTELEAEIYEDTVRLHILANSDSDEDQRLKIEIRDRILLKYGENLRKFDAKSEAEESINNLLPQIEKDAKTWVRELGYEYSVQAMLSEEWYETRDYGDFSLPCGIYTSLRIIIGSGEGQNWWCVMYPPLCTELACEDAPEDDGLIDYTNEEIKLIGGGKYQIKFKILEELSRCFAKNG
ncbi:MAG: stage II sporulation protein R [Clostridia bacterium]|nr:stage II sporulation protein R [Clostridia bacterium]